MDSKVQAVFLTLMVSLPAAGEGLAQANYPMPSPPTPASASPPRMPRSLTARDYTPRAGSKKKGKPGNSLLSETIAQKALTLEAHAEKALKAGDWTAVEGDCRQALALSPSPVRCWALMGQARFRRADYLGARDAFEMAVRIDASDAATVGQLGVTLARINQGEEARIWLGALRERLAACAGDCSDRQAIQAGIADIEAALAPKG